MLTCPRKNSREWQAILAEAKGNEEEAQRLWIEREFADNPKLNTPVTDENYEDARQGKPGQEELEPNDDFSKLLQRIKIYIKKQIEIIGSQKIKNAKYKQNKLQKLYTEIETLDGVQSINIFIKDAYDKAKQVEARFSHLLKNKKDMSSKEIMIALTGINDFANSYSILDEIDSADIMDYFTSQAGEDVLIGPVTPQKMLTDAIKIRDKVKKKIITEAIPLLAEYLVEYKSTLQDNTIQLELDWMNNKIQEIENDPKLSQKRKDKYIKFWKDKINRYETFNVDQATLEDILKMANRDEGVIDFLISPLITSTDSALALFAKAVKSQLEFARQKDISIRDELVKAFQDYKKVARASSDNTAKFNEGIYEEVDIPIMNEKGEVAEYRKEIQFVQKYDMRAYNKAKSEFFAKLGPLPQKVGERATKEEAAKIKAWWEARAKWFSENTVPRPKDERDAIISQMQKDVDNKLISEEDYKKWHTKNVREYNGKITYGEDLSTPSEKYKSKKWMEMYDKNDVPKNEKGKYHAELLRIYFQAQDKLPESQRKGFRVPSVSKSDLERMMQNGIKDLIKTNIKETFSMQSWDTEFALGSLSEEDVKFIPVYYTQVMDAKDVTLDFASSVLLFSAMANRYEALNSINSEISLMKAVVGARKVPETNSKGQAILDAFANKLGYEEFIRQNGESYSKKHLDAFIDMVVYGEMQNAEEIGNLSFAKLTNSIMSYSAITSIAADLLKGVSNNLQGNIQVLIEAAGGQFFNRKNLRRGKSFLAKNLPSVLADFGKPAPTSLLGKLVEMYDPMQGNFKDNYGRKVSMGVANKLFRTDTLFFNQHFGEYEIQVSTMLALFDGISVLDKTTNEEITLLQAYNIYGVEEAHNKIKISQRDDQGNIIRDDQGNILYVPFGESQRQDIQNRLHGLNKYMHGVYNDFDKGTIQKHSLGRLALMYRKHVVPGYKRRFKRVSMDHEIGAPTEGYYRTFADTMLKDLRSYKYNVIKNWSTYTPFQKAQITKVLTELTIILALATLGFVLTNIIINPDDDDREKIQDNYLYNFLLYEVIRMRSETASYINPIDALRVMRSPSAVTSTIDRLIKFMNQVAPWNITEEYKRDEGVWNKGDNKAWAAFLKLMGLSGYNIEPEAAYKSFESSFFK